MSNAGGGDRRDDSVRPQDPRRPRPPSIPPKRKGSEGAPASSPRDSAARPPAVPPRRPAQEVLGRPPRPDITRQGSEWPAAARQSAPRTPPPRTPLPRTPPPRAPLPHSTQSGTPSQRAAHTRPPDGPPLRPTPQEPGPDARQEKPRRARRSWWRRLRFALIAIVAVLAVAGIATNAWVEHRLTHVDALSGAADTPGQTYLIVGSDSRAGWINDGTVGARTDTIMVIHQPVHGPTALISIPRDSYVRYPGHGKNKINAAFAFGGPQLLVQTVEQLTGLTIDRYLEVGFLGVEDVVNGIGGVNLVLRQGRQRPLQHTRLEGWLPSGQRSDGPRLLTHALRGSVGRHRPRTSVSDRCCRRWQRRR